MCCEQYHLWVHVCWIYVYRGRITVAIGPTICRLILTFLSHTAVVLDTVCWSPPLSWIRSAGHRHCPGYGLLVTAVVLDTVCWSPPLSWIRSAGHRRCPGYDLLVTAVVLDTVCWSPPLSWIRSAGHRRCPGYGLLVVYNFMSLHP